MGREMMGGARISFDRIADRYDETRAFPNGVPERIAEAIKGFARDGDPILDIGVGTGRLAAPLHSSGVTVVGVDVSAMMLSRARAKGLDMLILADARSLPFPDDAFGLCISVHVTHLIPDWRRALEEIGRVTSEWYASVTTDRGGCEVDGMQKAYEGACAEQGYDIRHPGLRERELADLVEPASVVEIADCREDVPTTVAMERYRSRVYSDLWDVPDPVHDYAMARLTEIYGVTGHLERRERITLVVWDAEDIRTACRQD